VLANEPLTGTQRGSMAPRVSAASASSSGAASFGPVAHALTEVDDRS
jgi:hypothetical protein